MCLAFTRLALSSIIFFNGRVLAQIWCGKNYLPGQPVVPPGGTFSYPTKSKSPLLVFRCTPRIRPYLEDDVSAPGEILIDAFISHQYLDGANLFPGPLPLSPENSLLQVTISTGDQDLGGMTVHLNTTISSFFFPLSMLTPRRLPYDVNCFASLKSDSTIEKEQTFQSRTSLLYLRTPEIGSITKMDNKIRALLVKEHDKYQPIYPIGFYTSFGGYLDTDLSILDNIKAQGFNLVHPVPPFGEHAALEKVLERMEELGLYLMYDMRHTFGDKELLTKEVEMIKARRNLLLWYTADEPDGNGDALNATTIAYNLIHALDGYHPVSLALNCADYHFTSYTRGADIILPDPYTIGNNVTFSTKYHTPCSVDFGCCGCDNCVGNFSDIRTRLDSFEDRLQILGWDKSKMIWSVTQAFGGEEFWGRAPTGREWLLQALLSINHGARGIIPWIDPTPPDIKTNASLLAKSLPDMTGIIFNPTVLFTHSILGHIDVGVWSTLSECLVVAVNLGESLMEYSIPGISLSTSTSRWLLQEGIAVVRSENLNLKEGLDVLFESFGSGVMIINDMPTSSFHDEL